MIQELYQRAMKFAGEKHSEQKVPGTYSNYLLHISNVAMEVMLAYYEKKDFDINFAIQVAILHDIIEDTDCDFKELKKEFGKRVAIAVQALTKDESLQSKKERMADSLNKINSLEKEEGIVKLADRITNLQEPPANWDTNKIFKYLEEAKMVAESLIDKNEYLLSRINNKIKDYEKYTKRL